MSITAKIGPERTLIWLASYPKSGNTWLRSLLTAYLTGDREFDLNTLIGPQYAFERQLLDDHAGISSAEFYDDELIPYQAQVIRHLAASSDDISFIKTHSAYHVSTRSVPLFPAEASAGVIYIVRNPCDVAPSLAHHGGRDVDWAIARMANMDVGAHKWIERSGMMLPQWMSDWSGNVASWIDQSAIPLFLVRYEELHRDTAEIFSEVLRFCAITVDEDRVRKAIERCQIDRLQADEATGGFDERPSPERQFFRTGKVGSGTRELSKDQLQAIIQSHGKMMERLGYSADQELKNTDYTMP